VSEPIDAVLFDFTGTLAIPEGRDAWLAGAAATLGLDLGGDEAAAALAEELERAGRPGPFPVVAPPELAEVWARRDHDPDAHREAYVGLLRSAAPTDPRLAEALYARIRTAGGWLVYPDAPDVLGALRERGIRTALVSNVGFDLRPVLSGLGLLDLLDACVLSYEVGAIKPEPEIFAAALAALDVPAARALMVGDNGYDDGGAALAGIRTLLLPVTPAGAPRGLDAVLRLV
jgi:HAD superfamily hydrolase (TIGR01509 family)